MSLVQDLLPHMRRVSAADRDLSDLALIWAMIESTSAISCPEEAETILPTLVQTREAFAELHQRLVQQLGTEQLGALREELSSTAQCTIDILVRNLFERTADVGFLATDSSLQQFCAAPADERAAGLEALRRRLHEYREKYTVYDDIVLLSPAGEVLARLDTTTTLSHSADPILAQSLQSTGYVQQFAPSDLAIGSDPALLYGHRIHDARGRCVGVLVLRFRLQDEMQRIFDSVSLPGRSMAVLLLDEQGRVVVTNDASHVPLGAQMQVSEPAQLAVSVFAGREYLGVTCPTRGYQGYPGLGWRAHAMVSLLTAFHQRSGDVELQQGVALANPELHRVQADVDAINRNLRRVVWNGRLSTGPDQGNALRLKAVLKQVNVAGERMRARVGSAIQDLYRASLGRARYQAADLARMAADIMDRNLYERANDCRWWALAPQLQQVLAAPAQPKDSETLGAMLAHINSLYTVYTRLVAFDAHGVVRAVSCDTEGSSLVGTTIDAELLAATLALHDSQRYAVSPFGVCAVSDGMPTYTYLAAVRCPHTRAVVGGVAIVFNAQAEFRAMLADVLGERQGIAAFVDEAGRVIASTDASHLPGQPFPIDLSHAIVEHEGANWVLERVRAQGYREFNASGGYQHGVSAVVVLRLGALERRRAALYDRSVRAQKVGGRGASLELAVFQVGAGRYALPAQTVSGAQETDGLVRLPAASSPVIGLLDLGTPGQPLVCPVICGRQLLGLTYPARENDGVVVVITEESGSGLPVCGLRVDDVSGVLDVPAACVQALPDGLRATAPYLDSVVRAEVDDAGAEPVLLQLLVSSALATMAAGVQRQPTAPTAALGATPAWGRARQASPAMAQPAA